MNNILCLAVSKILDNDKLEYNQNIGTDNTYKIYQAMSEILIHSAETFIQEDFDIVVFEDQVENYQEIFHKNFQNVHDTWLDDGPNNILYLDCDTLVTAPAKVFGRFPSFQLFNYTDPKTLQGKDADNKYGLMHEHYFNAGVRYYPDTMPEDLWDLGWKYASDWDYNIWGTEQIIFNEMMYSQDPDYKTWLMPEMNYQAMNLSARSLDDGRLIRRLNDWNGCDINDAKIMHLHGTRGAGNTLGTQWEMWRRITGEEFEFSCLDVVLDNHGQISTFEPKK